MIRFSRFSLSPEGVDIRKYRNEGLNGVVRLLRLSVKILALLRLSVNFFQLRLTKKLKITFFSLKELNITKPVFSIFKAK